MQCSDLANVETGQQFGHYTILVKLREIIEEGSLMSDPMLGELAPYSRYRESLWCQDGVILLGVRTVVPHLLQNRIANCLHSAHQGVAGMFARAEKTVYWPGLYADLQKIRSDCKTCRVNAPSNPKLPPHDPPKVDYPFQEIVCDYMALNGVPYLISADRCTNWPDVRRAKGENRGSKGLISTLRDLFTTFGIPEVMTSDGGPEFASSDVKSFLDRYGVIHRTSSVGNPHANQRAEVAVKSMKRLLRGNVGPLGNLDNDAFAKAILQYRNTPTQNTGMSPAMALFGRQLRDFIPVSPGNYIPSPQWTRLLLEREFKYAKSQLKEHDKWSEHSRKQLPLKVGHIVSVQNLAGNHPLKWDRSGVVVEVRQHDQYGVKLDGSNRVTFRNRKHLRILGFRNPNMPFADTPVSLTGGGRKENIVDTRTPLQGRDTIPASPPSAETKSDTSQEFYTPRESVSQPVSSPAARKDTTFNPPIVSTPLTSKEAIGKSQKQAIIGQESPRVQSSPSTRRSVASPGVPGIVPTPQSPGISLKHTATPSRVVQMKPRKIENAHKAAEPMKIHHELRSHLKSGPKDVVPKDLSGPMKTRSGKLVQGKQ